MNLFDPITRIPRRVASSVHRRVIADALLFVARDDSCINRWRLACKQARRWEWTKKAAGILNRPRMQYS